MTPSKATRFAERQAVLCEVKRRLQINLGMSIVSAEAFVQMIRADRLEADEEYQAAKAEKLRCGWND